MRLRFRPRDEDQLELAVGVDVPKLQLLAQPENSYGHDQGRRQRLALKERKRSFQAPSDFDTEKGNCGKKGRHRKENETIKISDWYCRTTSVR